jgi:hypothetical protein
LNGRIVGKLFESYANPNRRFAQNGIWIDLLPGDCARGSVAIELDSSASRTPWTEAGYEATLYSTKSR